MRPARVAAAAGVFLAALAVVTVRPRAAAAQPTESPAMALVREGFALRERGDLAGAIAVFRRAVAADPASTLPRLHLGYALLAAERTADAMEQFREITRRDPGYVLAYRQLAHLYSGRGDLREARQAFATVDSLGGMIPVDWLELGRVQARRGVADSARAAYQTAALLGDSTTRAAAAGAIASLAAPTSAPVRAPRAPRAPQGFVEIYSVPLYQSRFSLLTGQGVLRVGLTPRTALRVSPYASLRVVTDSRSVGGPQALIFSENAILPALGVRAQPFGGPVGAYAELGRAFPIVVSGDSGRRARTDARAGVYLFDGWSLARTPRTDAARPGHRIELYADVNYLSRFDDDVFASAQLRAYYEALRLGQATVELVARTSVVGDRNRYPWANAAEVSGGVSLAPTPRRRVVLFAEQVGGAYLREPQVAGHPRYADFRVMAVIFLGLPLGR